MTVSLPERLYTIWLVCKLGSQSCNHRVHGIKVAKAFGKYFLLF
jgi:hypothetical protein